MKATLLPFAGTYTFQIVPDGSGTGTGTLTYYSITDQVATLKLNAAKTTAVTLSTPGQLFLGTFTGQPGNEISVAVSAAAFTDVLDPRARESRGAARRVESFVRHIGGTLVLRSLVVRQVLDRHCPLTGAAPDTRP